MLTKIDFCGATGHDHGVSIESSGGGGGSGNGGGDNNQQRAAKTAAAAIASSGGGGGGGGSGNSGGDNNQQRAAKTTVAAMVRKRRRQVMRLFFWLCPWKTLGGLIFQENTKSPKMYHLPVETTPGGSRMGDRKKVQIWTRKRVARGQPLILIKIEIKKIGTVRHHWNPIIL